MAGAAAAGGVAWTTPFIVDLGFKPAAAASGDNYTWEFDGTLDGWTVTNPLGGSNPVIWSPSSGGVRYGTGSSYATGNSRNAGRLTSPTFEVPTSGAVLEVTFDITFEFEQDNNYDRLFLYWRQGASRSLLWAKASLIGLPGVSTYTASGWPVMTSSGSVVGVTVNVASLAGQTGQLEFDFDTMDGSYNRYDGILIDNVSAPATAPPSGAARMAYGVLMVPRPEDPPPADPTRTEG